MSEVQWAIKTPTITLRDLNWIEGTTHSRKVLITSGMTRYYLLIARRTPPPRRCCLSQGKTLKPDSQTNMFLLGIVSFSQVSVNAIISAVVEWSIEDSATFFSNNTSNVSV